MSQLQDPASDDGNSVTSFIPSLAGSYLATVDKKDYIYLSTLAYACFTKMSVNTRACFTPQTERHEGFVPSSRSCRYPNFISNHLYYSRCACKYFQSTWKFIHSSSGCSNNNHVRNGPSLVDRKCHNVCNRRSPFFQSPIVMSLPINKSCKILSIRKDQILKTWICWIQS